MTRQRTVITLIRDVCYWFGILASIACFSLVLSSNTAFGWRFEHGPIPSSWLIGFIAVIAFIAAEIFGSERLSVSHATSVSAELEPSTDVVQQEA